MTETFEAMFGHQLVIERAKARLSRKQLSEKSGVSEDTIGKYERGVSGPLLSTADALAKALGCSVNDLCGF